MKRVTTEYYCDGCGNEIETGSACITFGGTEDPARRDITLDYHVEVPGVERAVVRLPAYDTHFCCFECFLKWVIKWCDDREVDVECFMRHSQGKPASPPSPIIEVQ